MASADGERGPGRARRAGTSRMNLVGLQAFESPGAPRPLQRAHGPTPLLHARAAYGARCACTDHRKLLELRGKGAQ